jgi:hypothetical protein
VVTEPLNIDIVQYIWPVVQAPSWAANGPDYYECGKKRVVICRLNVSPDSSFRSIARLAAAGIIILLLLVVPTPLLPPHLLAEAVQSAFGISWKVAYLAAAVSVQVIFYSSLGMLAALVVERSQRLQGRIQQIVLVPLLVVTVAMVIRSLKTGHLPVWINAAVPVAASLCGTWIGLGLLYLRWKATLLIVLIAATAALWTQFGATTAEVSSATEENLRRLATATTGTISGDARFVKLLQSAFAPHHGPSQMESAIQQNRAAILALGVSLGDDRLARMIGLKRNSQIVREAALLRTGTTLRGRDDWARHFCLSAALAVLEHPLISDAGGLMKEQMDALTGGSGFSFGDLAADRAGVRFAIASTHSEAAAKAMQERLQRGVTPNDFFPSAADLPENLTPEEFRRMYGGVGSQLYRKKISEIEQRLDRCSALVVPGL